MSPAAPSAVPNPIPPPAAGIGARGVTRGQRQALTLIARGKSGAETAALLGVSRGAIDATLLHARRALRARNTAHAAALAVALGLVDAGVLIAEQVAGAKGSAG